MDWSKTKLAFLLVAGPLGSYLAYQYFFVFRYLDITKYPYLTAVYEEGGKIFDSISVITVLAILVYLSFKNKALDGFKPHKSSLKTPLLALLTLSVILLMLLNVYVVLEEINLHTFIQDYDYYYYQSTNGSAWMILLNYALIFIILFDMYFAGVTKTNMTFAMLNIMIVSLNGGRGLPILFVITFLILLLFQKIRFRDYVVIGVISFSMIALSYSTITELRAPSKDKISGHKKHGSKSTDDFYELNYNAAFIVDDVLKALKTGAVEPKAYSSVDAKTIFIPRILFPEKPNSTAETIAIYPDVAKRGTNIAFPLKANIMMHIGPVGFYFDWLVVLIVHIALFIGIRLRNQSANVVGFLLVFWGCAFSLIARGGIFNARLIVLSVCVLIGYVGYLLFLKIQERYLIKN